MGLEAYADRLGELDFDGPDIPGLLEIIDCMHRVARLLCLPAPAAATGFLPGITEWLPPKHWDFGRPRTNCMHHPERPLTPDDDVP